MADIVVIGGGAAGMMAAAAAALGGAQVLLLEKNKKLGKKLRITGKGRCNVTNNCDQREIMNHTVRNPKFLYGALNAFDAQDTMALFERLGVALKTERGNRVFPVSDRAEDIVHALESYLDQCGVKRVCDTVTEIQKGFTVIGERSQYPCKKCIIATGGVSYPLTGSTGDGYRFAADFGHTIIPPRASLVGLRCAEKDCLRMSGLSLKNVTLTVMSGQKTLFHDFGEMLFTHTGISGPLVLSASAVVDESAKVFINLKPALTESQLDARILRDFSDNINKDIGNALGALLPKKMILPVLENAGLNPHEKVHLITKEQRTKLLNVITRFPLTVIGKEPIEGAIITAGGVDTREIVPKTMQSKKCPDLYFAGEVMDVDAYTGGFNLQIAFSTGYLAGTSASGGLYENN